MFDYNSALATHCGGERTHKHVKIVVLSFSACTQSSNNAYSAKKPVVPTAL